MAVATLLAAAAQAGAVTVSADLDGNRIYDDLEQTLAARAPQQRVGVIVVLHRDVPLARLRAAAGPLHLRRRLPIIHGFSARLTGGQVRTLASLAVVRHIEQMHPVHAFNDQAQASTGVTQARVDAPWLDGNADGDAGRYSASDMVAAVVDTGIDAKHHDLDGGKVIGFHDVINGRTTPYDDEGHGTHVAGILAGDGSARADRRYRGVAPGAALVGVKVLDGSGVGQPDSVVTGIQWVVDHRAEYGIKVMNLSLGGAGCVASDNATALALDAAADAGILPVVAAGNSGPDACTVGDTGSGKKTLTVGNMYDPARGGWMLNESSSRGPTADGVVKPDIAAPGTEIVSDKAGTTAGYVAFTGTSMASPFAAGVALLMRQADPALDPAAVKARMMAAAVDWGRGSGGAADPLPKLAVPGYGGVWVAPFDRWEGPAGSTGPDIDYGAGRIDAYRALQAAGAPLTAPPAAPKHLVLEGELTGADDADHFQVPVTATDAPVAVTLTVAEGQIYRTLVLGAGGGNYTPDVPLLTLRDPAGQTDPTIASTGRTDLATDATPTAGTYQIDVRPPAQMLPEQLGHPLRYFIDVSHG